MKPPLPDDFQRGDVIRITWEDVCGDVVGNPNSPTVPVRHTVGLFWSRPLIKGREYIVTTTTIDTDVEDQQGYDIYPIGMILSIKIVKRVRRPRTKKVACPTTATKSNEPS